MWGCARYGGQHRNRPHEPADNLTGKAQAHMGQGRQADSLLLERHNPLVRGLLFRRERSGEVGEL